METKTITRNNYLDWLRVLLILTVFFFHSLRFFDLNDWQIKNPTTYFGPLAAVFFISSWMMPLIFVVSGASIYYALRKGSSGRFIHDRSLRLLVPLAVGLFTHAALQAYLERITHGWYSGAFWQFYPGYVGSAVTGSFNWTGFHLWYLEALFAFSLLCLPLLQWLRKGAGTRLGVRLAASGAIYLPALLVALFSTLPDPNSSFLFDFMSFGGWNIPSYLVFFLVGFLVVASERLQARILSLRWVSLAIGLVTTLAYFGLYAAFGDLKYGSLGFALIMPLRGISGWCWTLGILALGMQRLTSRPAWLNYANEAVLPFYVLHQSVLIVIGYFVVQSGLPDLLKWAVIVASSFATIMILYEGLIRRINVLRFLFGMKALKKEETPAVVPARA